jgi:transposase
LRDTEGVVRRSVGKRRRFSKAFRRQVVQETLAPGASVAGVALRHRLNANLVFTWRRKLLPTLAPMRVKSVKLLPVTVTESPAAVPALVGESIASIPAVRRYRVRGAIEIQLNGARIVLKGAVDGPALRLVLEALVSR